jgi:hypothetical protein
MKKVSCAIAMSIVLAMMTECKKADEVLNSLTQFTFETDYVVRVPATPITNVPVDLVTPDIATHSSDAFSANKTNADLVQKIQLSELTLSVKTPIGGTLTFLKSVDIYARGEGLPEVRVAHKDIVPQDVGDTLSLDVTDADLTEYFKKDKYQLHISVITDEALKEDYGVNAHGKFFVDAKVLGH